MNHLTLLIIEDCREVREYIAEEIEKIHEDITVLIPSKLIEAHTVCCQEKADLAFFDFDLSLWETTITGEDLLEEYLEMSHADLQSILSLSTSKEAFTKRKVKHIGRPGLISLIQHHFDK